MKKYTTFYLDADVVDKLNTEKNKSAIVNSILKNYLEISPIPEPQKNKPSAGGVKLCPHRNPIGYCFDKKKDSRCVE